MKRLVSVFCFTVFLISSVLMFSLHAQLDENAPWPMFRHDARNTGVSPNAGTQTAPLSWSYATGEGLISSPVIGPNGAIYLGSYDNNVYAIISSGSLIWSYRTGGSISYASAGVDTAGQVFYGSQDNNIYAISSSGGLAWSYVTPYHIWWSSPAIGSDGNICIAGGKFNRAIYKLTSTGSFMWSYYTNGNVYASPAIGSGGRVFAGADDYRFYALNSTGSLSWSYRTGGEVYSSAAIDSDGRLYVGTLGYEVYALASEGTFLWSYITADNVYSSPAIYPDGRVFVGSSDDRVYALTSAGAFSWSYRTGDYIESSPALDSTGSVYIGSQDDNIYAITSEGVLIWSYAADGVVRSSPAIGADGRIFFASSDNVVYAIGPTATPTPTPTATPTATPTPLIDLKPDKQSFSSSDTIVVTADVQAISTPFFPFVRIVMPNGQTLYYVRGEGFVPAPTPYLSGGPFVLQSAILDYPVLSVKFSGVAPGTYYLEGGAVDATQTTSVNNIVYLGTIDRETLTVE